MPFPYFCITLIFKPSIMKKIFLITFAVLSTAVFAQKNKGVDLTPPEMPIDESTKLITYTEVVNSKGSADQIYNQAYTWASHFYKNPANVIKVKDKTNHKLVIKPRYKILNPPTKKGLKTMGGIVLYQLTIETKENKYRYVLTKIHWKQPSYYPVERWLDTSKPSYTPKYGYYLQQVDAEAKRVIDDLKKTLSMPKEKKSDNW